MDLAETINDLNGAFGEFKSANDAKLAETTRRMDGIERRMNRQGLGFGGSATVGDSDDLTEHKAAFGQWLRTGRHETRSMSVGTDPEGGYTVQPELSASLMQIIRQTSPIRSHGVRTVSISSDAWEEIIDRDDVTANWVDERTTRAETSTPDLGLYRIPVWEMNAEPKVTQKLIDDSSIDISTWLLGKVGDKFTRMENGAFINGSGLGKPKGLFSYPTAATGDDSRAWGTFEHIATGVSGALASSNPADVFFECVSALNPGYRQGAVWLMPRSVILAVRKLKTSSTNEYLWQPGLQLGQPDRLLGYEVVECADIADPSDGSLSVCLANLSRCYVVVDRLGVTALRDPYTARPFTIFSVRRRVGGAAANYDAAKFIKFSA